MAKRLRPPNPHHLSFHLRAAVRHQFIPRNPFEDLKGGVRRNRQRMRFIDREMTQKVIEACPDWEWRLLVVLARYGGLRTPSHGFVLWAAEDSNL